MKMGDTNQIILNKLRLEGCLINVKYFENDKNDNSDFTWKEAEILSTKTIDNTFHSYVHYTGWNKRLDEWVTRDRLDLSSLKKKEVRFWGGERRFFLL